MRRWLALRVVWLVLLALDALIAMVGESTWKQERANSRRHWRDLTQ